MLSSSSNMQTLVTSAAVVMAASLSLRTLRILRNASLDVPETTPRRTAILTDNTQQMQTQTQMQALIAQPVVKPNEEEKEILTTMHTPQSSHVTEFKDFQQPLVEIGLDAHVENAWKFYRSLGSPKFIVAPMVNQSELAFRLLANKYKADLCFTPMMHSHIFRKDPKYRQRNFVTTPEDRPLVAQFCSHDADDLLAAARLLVGQVDAIDLNLGCPQNIAKRGNYGAFLLDKKDWPLLRDMVSNCANNLAMPITCKIRILPDLTDTLDLALMLQNAGCSILTVHGRTRSMIKQRIGPCDFDAIKKIKEILRIPVFSNGEIGNLSDIEACLQYTGCDGVMVSEAILSNPAIFTGTEQSPLQLADEYLALAEKSPHTEPKMVRAHLFKILFRELSYFTELRNSLGNMKLDKMMKVTDTIRELERAEGLDCLPEDEKPYYKAPTWYRRHLDEKIVYQRGAEDEDEQSSDEEPTCTAPDLDVEEESMSAMFAEED